MPLYPRYSEKGDMQGDPLSAIVGRLFGPKPLADDPNEEVSPPIVAPSVPTIQKAPKIANTPFAPTIAPDVSEMANSDATAMPANTPKPQSTFSKIFLGDKTPGPVDPDTGMEVPHKQKPGILQYLLGIGLPAITGLAMGVKGGVLPGALTGLAAMNESQDKDYKTNLESYTKQKDAKQLAGLKGQEIGMQGLKLQSENDRASKDLQVKLSQLEEDIRKNKDTEGARAVKDKAEIARLLAEAKKAGQKTWQNRLLDSAGLGEEDSTQPSQNNFVGSNVHPALPGESYADYLKRVNQ